MRNIVEYFLLLYSCMQGYSFMERLECFWMSFEKSDSERLFVLIG